MKAQRAKEEEQRTSSPSHPFRPRHSGAEMRELGLDVRADPGVEFAVVVEDSQGVFAHLRAGKEFWGSVSKVQTQLHGFALDLGTEFVVCQQQATLRARGGPTGIQEPGGRSRGVGMEQDQQFLLQVPEIPQRFFGDRERAQMHHRLEKAR